MARIKQHSQNGVALLTVLLVVGLMGVVVAKLATTQKNLANNSQQFKSIALVDQAQRAVDQLALSKLTAMMANNTNGMGYQQIWPNQLPETQYFVDGLGLKTSAQLGAYQVQYRIMDVSSVFNVNAVVDANGAVNKENADVMRAYLENVASLPPENVEALIDWIDSDDTVTGSMGAEKSYYDGLSPKVVIDNAPLYDLASLSLVRGFDAIDPDSRRNDLTALAKPQQAPADFYKLNINTSSPTLLAGLTGLSTQVVEEWAEARRQAPTPYASVADFWGVAPFSSVDQAKVKILTPILGVKSTVFAVVSQVSLNDSARKSVSYYAIEANSKPIFIKREWLN